MDGYGLGAKQAKRDAMVAHLIPTCLHKKGQIASLPLLFHFASCKFLTHIHYACLSYIQELFPILHFPFAHSIF